MAAQTICPSCGYGPIPEGVENCPECSTQFAANPLFRRARSAGGHGVYKDSSDLDATRTTLGAITSAVDAHPAPTAAVLGGAAGLWVFRCVGVLSDRPQPSWPLALAALQMGIGMMLLASAGPARVLAQLAALAQIAVALLVGGSIVTVAGHAGVGAALLLLTLGEPSDIRRWLGAGAGLATLAAGAWGLYKG